jgi:hypothetical protein
VTDAAAAGHLITRSLLHADLLTNGAAPALFVMCLIGVGSLRRKARRSRCSGEHHVSAVLANNRQLDFSVIATRKHILPHCLPHAAVAAVT